MCSEMATYSHDNTTKANIRTQPLSYPGAFPEWTKYPGKKQSILSASDVPDIHIYICMTG